MKYLDRVALLDKCNLSEGFSGGPLLTKDKIVFTATSEGPKSADIQYLSAAPNGAHVTQMLEDAGAVKMWCMRT